MENNNRAPSLGYILLLVLAGEAIFLLPFVLQRVFKSTFLNTLEITNSQLGDCFAIYGLVALVSYLFGGIIADRFSPRVLLSIALFMTALGGLYLAQIPSPDELYWLYAYWGFTTIFLFWAPLIKATRVWGGAHQQSRAFGFLDGGRGLVAALIGTLGVTIFTSQDGVESDGVQTETFQLVVYTVTAIVGLAGVLVLFLLKSKSKGSTDSDRIRGADVLHVLKLPQVWLLMLIVLCAYVGYKATDNFSQYAREVMNYSETNAGWIGTAMLFSRPIIGVGIGLLVREKYLTKGILFGFGGMILGTFILSTGVVSESQSILFILFTIICAMGVFAARVFYFSLLQVGRIPIGVTGTAIGLISVVGFAPDIFMGKIMGYFQDSYRGEEILIGHQFVFGIVAVFGVVGLIASYFFNRTIAKPKKVASDEVLDLLG